MTQILKQLSQANRRNEGRTQRTANAEIATPILTGHIYTQTNIKISFKN